MTSIGFERRKYSIRLKRGDRRRALPSLERNFNFAARAVRCEYQVDGAAELMRNEIADEAAAITGLDRSRNRRAAKLAPCDRQDRRGIGTGAVPAHRHSAVRAR